MKEVAELEYVLEVIEENGFELPKKKPTMSPLYWGSMVADGRLVAIPLIAKSSSRRKELSEAELRRLTLIRSWVKGASADLIDNMLWMHRENVCNKEVHPFLTVDH